MESDTPLLPEEAPSDSVEHSPRRKARKLLLDDNEGDYRAFLVHPGGPAHTIAGSPEIPKGTLIPLPNYPGFMTLDAANRHIRNRASQHHEMLSGQVIAVVKFHQIMRLELAQAVQVTMAKKPKRVIQATALDNDLPAE